MLGEIVFLDALDLRRVDEKGIADAENRAIEKCLKAGGVNPKIRWGFKG